MTVRQMLLGAMFSLFGTGLAQADPLACLDYEGYLHTVSQAGIGTNFTGVAVGGDVAYLISGWRGLSVFDLTDPAAPQLVGEQPLSTYPLACVRERDRLYVLCGPGGIDVFDVSDRRHPVEIGFLQVPGEAKTLVAHGRCLFIAAGSAGLQVAQVPRRGLPVLRGICDTPGNAIGVDVAGDVAYVADETGGLQVVNVADFDAPVLVRTLTLPDKALSVARDGNALYVGIKNSTVRAFDITDPQAPLTRGSASVGGWPTALAAGEGRLYCLAGNQLNTLSTADPLYPGKVGAVQTEPTSGLAIRGDLVVVSTPGLGFWVVDATNPVSAPMLGRGGGDELLGYTGGAALNGDYLYVSRRFHAIQIYDIGDATRIRLVKTFDITGQCYAIAAEGAYIYAACGGDSYQICDVSDIDHPAAISGIFTSGSANDVYLTPGLAHLASGTQGYMLADISDPEHPEVIAQVPVMGTAMRVVARDGFAYLATGVGLVIIDYRPPERPHVVSQVYTQGSTCEIILHGDYVYLHEHQSGLRAVNVSDPASPVVSGLLPLRDTVSALYARGDCLIAASRWFGLMVYDIADGAHPRAAGVGYAPAFGLYLGYSALVGDDRALYAPVENYAGRLIDVWSVPCAAVASELPASIDIEPRDPRNRVECDGHRGQDIEVALLTDVRLRAADVDVATVGFGPAGAPPLREGRGQHEGRLRDVDGDGDQDLLLRFRADQTGIVCGDVTAKLTGQLQDGRRFSGTDAINTHHHGPRGHESAQLAAGPNPFNPATTISFTLEEPDNVRLVVYDLAGRRVRGLLDEGLAPGPHEILWDGLDDGGSGVASGVYLARLERSAGFESVRLSLLK